MAEEDKKENIAKEAIKRALKEYIDAHPEHFEESISDEDLDDVVEGIETTTMPDFDEIFGG